MTNKTHPLRAFLTDEEIALLEDQNAPRSWVFEPYLRLTNSDAQNLVDLVMDDVCAGWMATFPMRRPSTEVQQKFWDCGSAILANLMRAKCSKWSTTIGMYRSKGALDRERRYRPDYMTADRFRTVQDWLQQTGYVAMVESGYNFPGNSQTSRFALTEKGASELQAGEWGFGDFKVDRGRETIRLAGIPFSVGYVHLALEPFDRKPERMCAVCVYESLMVQNLLAGIGQCLL